jgi:hypothetical protein
MYRGRGKLTSTTLGSTPQKSGSNVRQPAPRNALGLAIILSVVGVIAGCRAVAPGLGMGPTGARATADDLFGSIATRYYNVFREPKVRGARRRIMRSLLIPSKVFIDTSVWMRAPTATTRLIEFRGHPEPNRFRFAGDADVSPPLHPGEGRYAIRLLNLGDDDYEWLGTGEFGIGRTTPLAFANILVAWIAAGERADTAAIRADLHTAFARSTAQWGKLFSLESIATSRDASGAWTQRHVMTLHAERAAPQYPALAKWMHQYVSPVRMHLRLHDSTRTWFDAIVRNDSLIVTTRSRDGRVLPLEGGNDFLPDTVTLESDFSARLLMLRAGWRGMRTEFVTVRQPAARGWSLRFRKEPDWQLPPLAEQMLRTPLRRPFSGSGSSFRLVATSDSATAQTVLARRVLGLVHESAIYRFLSHLISGGVSEYVDGADRDFNAWLAASFGALRDDARAIIPAP